MPFLTLGDIPQRLRVALLQLEQAFLVEPHPALVLVDLVFANSGWRRLGEVGKTQKTVDIELMLPTTGERAFVQVKSSASKQDLTQYVERLKDSRAYDRMFFVWHSGDVGEVEESNVVLIGPDRLARMVFDAGLTSWLREKVS